MDTEKRPQDDSKESSHAKPLEIAQARLVLSISLTYARMGSESTYKRARSIHKDLTHYCYSEWYRGTMSTSVELPDASDRDATVKAWHKWRDIEIRRRMGYAIWVGRPSLRTRMDD